MWTYVRIVVMKIKNYNFAVNVESYYVFPATDSSITKPHLIIIPYVTWTNESK